MIGKAKSCNGGISIFNYVIKDEKGHELLRNNLCGETPVELLREMKIIQQLNQRATNKLFSMVLSPHIEDGQRLSKKELGEITQDFLKELEIDPDEAQFLAFVHTEKQHKHIHILLNRVKTDGKLLPDHHIGKKAHWAAHRVAEKHGLVSAKQMRIDKAKALGAETNMNKDVKKSVHLRHLEVISRRPLSLDRYISQMANLGVQFIPVINKQGDLQGFRVKDKQTGLEFKASDVHRTMSLNNLLKTISEHAIHFSSSQQQVGEIELKKQELSINMSNNENLLDVLLKPNYTGTADDELTKKRKKPLKR